jgi:hypothetical protein
MTRRKTQAGSALIEFAGSLILLATLLTGIFRIGYMFYTYENLVNAVRAGVRYASLRSSGWNAADPDLARSVRNLVVYGDPQPTAKAKPMTPGLRPENVELVLRPASATVSVRGFEIDSLFAKVRLDGRPTVTFPLTGAAR